MAKTGMKRSWETTKTAVKRSRKTAAVKRSRELMKMGR
jgi:hypothetical protein